MKYTVFADGGLQALVNQTKANKTVAADNTAALNGLSTDFENMSGQITNVFGDVETCLNELDTVKADAEKVNEALSKKSDVGHTHTNYASTVTTTGSGNAITAISQSGNTITATKGTKFSVDGHTHTSASTTAAGFMSAADKSKLDGIAAGANAYAHPSSHPASMITGLSKVATSGKYSDLDGAPTALPNAGALTFTGAVTGTYDGSSAVSVEIPTALKNPKAITFTGAVTGTYDGSSAVNVEIPENALVGSTTDITPAQVAQALQAGKTAIITHISEEGVPFVFSGFTVIYGMMVMGFVVTQDAGITGSFNLQGSLESGEWSLTVSVLATEDQIPTQLPNQYTLTIKGATTQNYNGEKDVTVEIPVHSVNGKTGAVSLSASDVGADASGAANTALTNAKAYTNEKISALINSAPTTLDTLGEIATAMENNADVVEALEDAIGTKANASDLTAHTGNTSNPHKVTKSQVGLGSVVNTGDSATPVSGGTTKFTTGGAYTELNKKVDKTTTVNGHALSGNVTVTKSDVGLGNVENKSSATIRGEITKANVTDALGYTPPTADSNTTYSISKSGSTITLTGSDGSTSTVTDSNSTYSNATLGQGYGTCATAAATAAKVVTLSSYSLTTGGVVSVKFTYAVPANATMNINSKGAKNIYYRGAKITAGIIEAGDIATFIYDGTQYHLLTVDRHRFFSLLVPYGVSIEASESSTTDINSVQYLKVGNYYCSANAKAKYVSNLPKKDTAFMMSVSSPLSTAIDNETTKTWVYRLRRLQYYTGEEYVQYCYAGATAGTWTYGEWKKVVLSDEITTLQNTITQLTNRIAALEASIGFVATESDM